MGKKEPTDVLAFPFNNNWKEGKMTDINAANNENLKYLGDIFISFPKIIEQAKTHKTGIELELNIILAQAGLFVSASSFEYMPYTQIFTRILNNDNIFRSQSSFAVEVHELKSILNRADSRSLVLGDELCSGTESTSALSIIATGLNTLCDRESTFIFTSHLHELTKLDEIKSLLNLEIYHLKIKYDKHTNLLMYDRKLEKGSGPSIYGLRGCEAMGMSDKFLSFAKKIQSKLKKKIITNQKITKVGSYSSIPCNTT